MCMIQDIRNCLQRLEEIALKPDPLSTVDYIDTLIQSEENEANPGFKDRVNVLQKIRKRAEVTMAVKKGEYRPFPGYEHLFNAKVTLGSHYS